MGKNYELLHLHLMKKFILITAYFQDKEFEKKKMIVEDAANHMGLILLMPDLTSKVNADVQITINLMHQSDFAIVDLSFERPSCYYEAGYLQAINKKIFLIAQQHTIIHLVSNASSITYYRNLDEYKQLIHQILKSE